MDLWLQLHEYRSADLAREAERTRRRRALRGSGVGARRAAVGTAPSWRAPRRGARGTGPVRGCRGAGGGLPCPAC